MTGGQDLATELSPEGLHFCEPLTNTFHFHIPLRHTISLLRFDPWHLPHTQKI